MMFYQKLSQALGQLKKGFCYDSPLGKIPTYEYLKPITASATAVLPAITLATGATTTIDQNRKQQTTVTISGTWAADDEANVTVSGTEVEFIALGSDTDDIAEGLAEAINDDETVSALVTAVAVGSVVTLTSVVIWPLTITAGEVTAGNGVATAALSVAPITQPDLPRNITVKGNAGGMAGNVVINGHDKAGYAITETIALSGSSEVVGSKAFARVTEIVLPARTAEANTVSIGLGVKLGLSRPIEATTDVKYATVDGTANAVSASDAGNGTITMTTAPNGSRVYIVYYDAVVL